MTQSARLLFLATALLGGGACASSDAPGGKILLSAAECSAAVAWAPSTSYQVGALVTFQGATYQCVQAHTSQADWTPSAVPALWSPTSCAGGGGGGTGGGGSTGSGGGGGTGSGGGGGTGGGGGGTGTAPAGMIFSPYKDTSINMNWNTNVISTMVSGAATDLASDLSASGGHTVTLAFATGECGSENWGGVPGAAMAAANVSRLTGAGIKYILSTGGAAGSFTCGSDAGFATFVDRWASANLIGIDFDIEAGQSPAVIADLIRRIQTSHAAHPGLRFSLTLATLANNNGASTAQSLGAGVADSFNTFGDQTLAAVRSTLGFNGSASTWPTYLTVNLMVMDYGAPSSGVCVVSGGLCDMGQSAIQAAFNLRDRFGVPMANIELTPMIGGNDVSSEHFTLQNTDAMTSFAIANKLAGVHYWSYDRDTDCTQGFASPTCNSIGGVGAHGFLRRFLGDGLR
ncbi:MAG TPA: carbohydrate-binding protein [Kofleriaceae bacterium]|jgi:hypothetical protein|nr:carbohydrate-binding protein [Kofleriaceae bacterium]